MPLAKQGWMWSVASCMVEYDAVMTCALSLCFVGLCEPNVMPAWMVRYGCRRSTLLRDVVKAQLLDKGAYRSPSSSGDGWRGGRLLHIVARFKYSSCFGVDVYTMQVWPIMASIESVSFIYT